MYFASTAKGWIVGNADTMQTKLWGKDPCFGNNFQLGYSNFFFQFTFLCIYAYDQYFVWIGQTAPELVSQPEGQEGFKATFGVEHVIPISVIQVEIGPVDQWEANRGQGAGEGSCSDPSGVLESSWGRAEGSGVKSNEK